MATHNQCARHAGKLPVPAREYSSPGKRTRSAPSGHRTRFGRAAPVIRVIGFVFNGVIADDETPHVCCFQQALAEAGLALTKEDYYGAYLGMDERTCTRMLLARREGTGGGAGGCRGGE